MCVCVCVCTVRCVEYGRTQHSERYKADVLAIREDGRTAVGIVPKTEKIVM